MAKPRFFVDSADRGAVRDLLQSGWVHGVTTNPTVLATAGLTVGSIPDLYDEWAGLGARAVFFQTWGESRESQERRARRILDLGDRAIVKIVATPDGLALGSRLSAEGHRVLMTAVSTPGQALAAAAGGIEFIAPYLGRLRDQGLADIADLCAMQELVGGPDGTGTRVLAASIRTPEDIVALARGGVSDVTAKPAVLAELLRSEATDKADAEFAAAPSLVETSDDQHETA